MPCAGGPLAFAGVLALAACASVTAPPAAFAPSVVTPSLSFGCPGGHLLSGGGAIQTAAAPLRASLGYAVNTGGLCAHPSASTSNVYGAPAPPSGWSAFLYVEVKFADRKAGEWKKAGPQEYVEISGKRQFRRSRYYCAVWYVADGSQWTLTWSSRTATPISRRKLKLAGAAPDYTPFFNAPFVLKTPAVMELLESPAGDHC